MMKTNRAKLMMCMANNCMNLIDLVRKCGLPYATVKNAVYGRSVRPATIGKIAKALGVNVVDIAETEQN